MSYKTSNPSDKIFYPSDRVRLLDELQHHRHRRKIVTINGCFDIFTIGHLYCLNKASVAGDILVVGLNSDQSVRKLKGDKRPILIEGERALMIAQLPFVDYIFIYDEETSEKFVESIKPDVHVNDASYGYDCVEKKILDTYGGELFLIDKIDNDSTTNIIERILERYGVQK